MGIPIKDASGAKLVARTSHKKCRDLQKGFGYRQFILQSELKDPANCLLPNEGVDHLLPREGIERRTNCMPLSETKSFKCSSSASIFPRLCCSFLRLIDGRFHLQSEELRHRRPQDHCGCQKSRLRCHVQGRIEGEK